MTWARFRRAGRIRHFSIISSRLFRQARPLASRKCLARAPPTSSVTTLERNWSGIEKAIRVRPGTQSASMAEEDPGRAAADGGTPRDLTNREGEAENARVACATQARCKIPESEGAAQEQGDSGRRRSPAQDEIRKPRSPHCASTDKALQQEADMRHALTSRVYRAQHRVPSQSAQYRAMSPSHGRGTGRWAKKPFSATCGGHGADSKR